MTTTVDHDDDCPSCGEPVEDHTLRELGECGIDVVKGRDYLRRQAPSTDQIATPVEDW